MKRKNIRWLSLLLAAVLLLGCLPARALAAENSWFYLVVDWNGELLIAPERVSYTSGQTLFEALNASGHSFGPRVDNISKIDGKAGSFIRSDENGDHDLGRNASEANIRYLRFVDNASGSRTAQPSAAMQQLIAAMADYKLEAADVQRAAKAEYDAACAKYCTASDADALELCTALQNAVKQYKDALDGTKYTVTFRDQSSVWTRGDTLLAENQYGRVYEDTDKDGALSLSAGSYTFTMQTQTGGMTGSFTVSGQSTVSVTFDTKNWLLTDGFQLSSRTKTSFSDGLFPVEVKSTRELEAAIEDTFASRLYAYWPYDTSLSPTPALTAMYTPAGETEAREAEQILLSQTSGIDGVLAAGFAGNTVIYRASMPTEAGYTQYQDYTLRIRRTPTLKQVQVTEETGSPAAFQGYDAETKTYTYLVFSETVALTLTPSITDGCEIYVNGEAVATEGYSIAVSGEQTSVAVELRAGEAVTRYTLLLCTTDSCVVKIPVTSADITLLVRDQNGQTVRGSFYPEVLTYSFTLVTGQDYTYTATKDTYYHAESSFTAGNKTLTSVSVPTDAILTELALGKDGTTSSKGSIALNQPFESGVHAYTATVPDTPSAVYLWIDGDVKTATSFTARYRTIAPTSLDDREKEVTISAAALPTVAVMQQLLMEKNGRGNVLTIRCSRKSGSVAYYQDYTVAISRSFSLKSLSVSCSGQEQVLTHSGGANGYTPAVRDYIVTVPAAARSLSLRADVYSDSACYRDNENTGYHVWLGEQELESGKAVDIPLSGKSDPGTVTLTLTNDYAGADMRSSYQVLVQKAAPVRFTPVLEPENALLFVREKLSGQRVWPDETGMFELSDGFTYLYHLTCPGYVGTSGTFGTIHDEGGALVLQIGKDTFPVSDGAVSAPMALEAAKINDSLEQLPAEWADFRGTAYDSSGAIGGSKGSNNTVLSVKTPVDADRSTLYWATQIGKGYDSGATGCPLLVDDVLITYAGQSIYRIDPISGEILASGKMERASSFAITPPAYAKGMVFIGLSDGTIQAFDANTLESVWVYHDALRGQPNCPITICGDYLYTGFWRGEEFPANFVCLSITDEDPTRTNEEKTACWYWTSMGGFYWAGAYANEDYVLIGTDDGLNNWISPTASLLMLDAKTGRLLDQRTGLFGDVRSSICYDAETEAFYFTTKGGWFCSIQTELTDDGWRLKKDSAWHLVLDPNRDPTNPAMSASTPVVYNGRAYVGVSGTAQFGAYSGHSITVVDLSSHQVAYRTETMGYPQTSGILTTAYEADSGCVYVYFIDNYTPGKLRVLCDSPRQTEATYVTKEAGMNTPYVLFTPSGDEAQYAICSPVVDSYGVMYYKNDTARMMAFGPSVELEIVKQPTKTQYTTGETFDPAGMQVELVYANGKRRDVTSYVTWPTAPLTEQDASFAISFPYVMYHDQDTENGHETNVTTITPKATVSLSITSDGTNKGKLGTALSWSYDLKSGSLHVTGTFETGWTLTAGCYDKEGRLLRTMQLSSEGTLALPADSAYIRLFLFDASSRPVCASATVKE